MRENLLKAAQKRVEAKIAELKAIESRIEGELKKRDDGRKAEYQRLVQMYSNMKPKDAARIFDRLDMNVLTGLVRTHETARDVGDPRRHETGCSGASDARNSAIPASPSLLPPDTLPKISSR